MGINGDPECGILRGSQRFGLLIAALGFAQSPYNALIIIIVYG